MPKKIISAMRRAYKGKNISEKEVNKRIYGKLNKMGFIRGNKETKKGVKAEAKYTRDH